jgi:hypothetical protein
MINNRLAPYGALLLRVSIGLLFLLHGLYLKAFVFGMAGTASQQSSRWMRAAATPNWLRRVRPCRRPWAKGNFPRTPQCSGQPGP